MREMCRSEKPEKLELFEALYAARFDRLWEQWGGPEREAREDGFQTPE